RGVPAARPDRPPAGCRWAAAPRPRRRMTVEGAAPTWPRLLQSLILGQDLTAEECRWVMRQVMAGESSPVQLAGFLVALRAKGETVAELTGLVEEMLAHARRIEVP